MFIDEREESMWADFEYVEVENVDVADSIHSLLRGRCQHISKSTSDNMICFVLWTSLVFDECAGIAMSLDGVNPPKPEFCTELVKINDSGWYYYYSDYETWRVEQTQGVD